MAWTQTGCTGVEPFGIWPKTQTVINVNNNCHQLHYQHHQHLETNTTPTICVCNAKLKRNIDEIEQHRIFCRFSC